MTARQPNFFIIGAPKCGTTALYTYLSEHPNVFMPRVKEPHYFASDFPAHQIVSTPSQYSALFEGANESHVAIGEASVFYMYSQVALPRIREEFPDAKILVMYRDPVDLAYSMHSQLLYGFEEDEPSFEVAWNLQEQRALGQSLPRGVRTPQLLQYRSLASVGEQIARVQSIISPELLKVISLDEFSSSPETCYADVLEFLGLPHDGRVDFRKVNANKKHRSKLLAQLAINPPFPLNVLKRGVKKIFSLEHSRLGEIVYRQLTYHAPRQKISNQLRMQINEEFESDRQILARCLAESASSQESLQAA